MLEGTASNGSHERAGTATPNVNSPCQCERTSESPVTVLSTQEQHRTASGVQQYRNVIDRINALYSGVGSTSQEEIDDDKYDSEDSFIDDRELKEYFAVDKTIKPKYSRFYVHRGPLEVVAADDPGSPQAGAKKQRRTTVQEPPLTHSGSTPENWRRTKITAPSLTHSGSTPKKRRHTTIGDAESSLTVVEYSGSKLKLTDLGSKPEKRRHTTIMKSSLTAVDSGSTPNREEYQNHLIQSKPSAAVQLKRKKRIVVKKHSVPMATSRQKPAQGEPKQCGSSRKRKATENAEQKVPKDVNGKRARPSKVVTTQEGTS